MLFSPPPPQCSIIPRSLHCYVCIQSFWSMLYIIKKYFSLDWAFYLFHRYIHTSHPCILNDMTQSQNPTTNNNVMFVFYTLHFYKFSISFPSFLHLTYLPRLVPVITGSHFYLFNMCSTIFSICTVITDLTQMCTKVEFTLFTIFYIGGGMHSKIR